MQYRISLSLLCGLAALPSLASAAPIVIEKTEAVADARRDLGTGVCGSAINFTAPPLQTVDAAKALLDLPISDPKINMKKATATFNNINFRNAYPGAEGDFKAPESTETWLPYSSDIAAVPRGLDTSIAFRLRGYLNVSSNNGGQPLAYGLNCNDACRLSIGKSKIVVLNGDDDDPIVTGTRSRQVIFKAPGLYPVELLYFQNANEGFVEWASTMMPQQTEDDAQITSFDKTRWKIVTGGELFNAITGTNPSCQECGSAGMDCSSGQYCGDGLCQPCDQPDHCGASCMRCPDNARLCYQGKCVQCTSDAMCPAGQSCTNGTCGPPKSCDTDKDCLASGKVCDPNDKICVTPPMSCKGDMECPAGQLCDAGFCRTKPMTCSFDSDCKTGFYCDTGKGICLPRGRFLYEGGLGGCSAGSQTTQSTSSQAGFAVLGLALVGMLAAARRRRTGQARSLMSGAQRIGAASLMLSVFFCVTSSDASAQSTGISLNAQQFRPAIGPENIFTVEGTRTPGRWVPMANVWAEYARMPLRVRDTLTNESLAVVPDMLTMHLTGGIGLTSWLSAAVDVPIIVYQTTNRPAGIVSDIPTDTSAAGLGDLRLVAKVRIIDNTEGGLGLAFVPQVTFPTGNALEFRGDGGFGFEPRLAVDYKTRQGFIVALNASVNIRTDEQRARNVLVSHQARYGLGAYLPLPRSFGALAELSGGTSFLNSESIYSPLEAYVGGRWIHNKTGITVNLGGGPGLTSVASTAQFRLFASIGYLPFGKKPAKPVPQPPPVVDLDPDRDGLIGTNDRCPTEWGPKENQGCPDVDTDKDGLIDREDRCPKEPGPKENQGCPDTNRDGDALVDRLDTCPDQPGPLENNGCPLLDTDKDSIPDKEDKCPYEPGPVEHQGCPPPRKHIQVTADKIELLQKIMFATNKADIKPASFDLLNEVVDVMKRRASMRVHIEGHTDPRGTLVWNMKLSKMRADSVRQYLLQKGVEADRLTSEGYGPTRPVAGCEKAKTTLCHDKNRRTEFMITQQ